MELIMTLMNQRQTAAFPHLSQRERLLTQREAAEYLGLSERTLERWRVIGSRLRYVKLKRGVRYRQIDLEAFVNAGLRQSTSEEVRQ
jgi:excisionase family DNA binding protein